MKRTGHYISQLQGELQYKAFTPNTLPVALHWDDKLYQLVSQADQSLGRLDGIAEILPDVDFFIFMYIRKEATLSSQVEGTQATFSDVLKAEAKIHDQEIHKDVDEIRNYIQAMNHGLDRIKSFPLSWRLIREIHATLLKGVRGENKYPGEFRSSQNWVGGATIRTARYIPPPPHEMKSSLDNLEKFMHDSADLPVLVKAALLHAQFETIHPFLDGNGRVGRLLITFYLCQQQVLSKPLLYLSEYFKKYRSDYYERLDSYHEKDDIEGWVKFFLEGVSLTAQNAVSTTRKILKLREQDLEKVMSMGRSQNGKRLLDSLYKRPYIKTKDVEKVASLSNPNALALIRKFEKAGILKEITGQQRNRVYVYDAYLKLFE
jgi:Fic family protein